MWIDSKTAEWLANRRGIFPANLYEKLKKTKRRGYRPDQDYDIVNTNGKIRVIERTKKAHVEVPIAEVGMMTLDCAAPYYGKASITTRILTEEEASEMLKARMTKLEVGKQKMIIHPEGTPQDVADAVSQSIFAKEVKAAYTPSDSALFKMDLGVGRDYTPSEPIVVTSDKNVVDKFRQYKNSVGLDTVSLEEKYNAWILENIHVYELFKKFTLQAIAAGKKKISHWLIVNRMRWEMEIETKALTADERKYKISNDYIAFLARDFVKDHPEHADIFNLKMMKRV